MAKSKKSKTEYSQAEIARMLNISRNSVSNLLSKTNAPKPDSNGKYDLCTVVDFYIHGDTQTPTTPSNPDIPTAEDFAVLKASGMELENSKIEIQNARELNQLLPLADVQNLLVEISTAINAIGSDIYPQLQIILPMQEQIQQAEISKWWFSKMDDLRKAVTSWYSDKKIDTDTQKDDQNTGENTSDDQQ